MHLFVNTGVPIGSPAGKGLPAPDDSKNQKYACGKIHS